MTELHVHDWSPWGPSPLSDAAGVVRRQRSCRGCELYQDEPTPGMRETPVGLVPDSAISAAAAALVGEESGYCGPGYGTCGSLHVSRQHAADLAREALAAAVPHIERAIRAEVAAAALMGVVPLPDNHADAETVTRMAMQWEADARVARGGETG